MLEVRNVLSLWIRDEAYASRLASHHLKTWCQQKIIEKICRLQIDTNASFYL